jgi:hypothetical protein
MIDEKQQKANNAWIKTIDKMWEQIRLSNEKFNRNMTEKLRLIRKAKIREEK